jgi:hypothetical protein
MTKAYFLDKDESSPATYILDIGKVGALTAKVLMARFYGTSNVVVNTKYHVDL